MARKKIIHPDIEQIAEKEGVVFFKIRRPLTESEHTLLSDRVRFESDRSKIKIVLVPHSCDLDFGGEEL
jgi:hypothetical protein